MVLRGLAFCLLTVFLAGCIASAALTIVSQTAKTAARAAGAMARITMDGARTVAQIITRSLRKEENENTL